MPLRVAFFGLPLAALLLARDGYDVCFAAICRPGSLGTRRLRRVIGAERVLVRPTVDAALVAEVASLRPDLIVSWFWTKRLPMSLIHAAPLGGLGVHPSLLPRHRGPDPTYWAIASGDEVTGVTVHRIAEHYDTGAILDQERLGIDPRWTAWDLARALDRPSLRALRRVVGRLSRGERVEEHPQDEAAATLAPAPDDEGCAIRWSWSVDRVLRQVRALAPAPGAWTEVNGSTLVILRAARAASVPAALEPGEAAIHEGLPLIAASDGAIVVLEAELDEARLTAADLADLFLPEPPLVLG